MRSLDMTFCTCKDCELDCFRKMTDEQKAYWEQYPYIPISFADFSEICELKNKEDSDD